MQFIKCKVRLSGNMNSVVPRDDVSVAEVLVLRAIHGGDAVIDIQPIAHDLSRISSAQEVERLCSLYSPRTVRGVFPGSNPSLPSSLADIGIATVTAVGAGENDAPIKAKTNRKSTGSAPAVASSADAGQNPAGEQATGT